MQGMTGRAKTMEMKVGWMEGRAKMKDRMVVDIPGLGSLGDKILGSCQKDTFASSLRVLLAGPLEVIDLEMASRSHH